MPTNVGHCVQWSQTLEVHTPTSQQGGAGHTWILDVHHWRVTTQMSVIHFLASTFKLEVKLIYVSVLVVTNFLFIILICLKPTIKYPLHHVKLHDTFVWKMYFQKKSRAEIFFKKLKISFISILMEVCCILTYVSVFNLLPYDPQQMSSDWFLKVTSKLCFYNKPWFPQSCIFLKLLYIQKLHVG